MNTDHKPLIHLFGEHCGIPQLVSARIQRWALILCSYTYSVQYKPSKELPHADGMGRLPLPDTLKSVPSLLNYSSGRHTPFIIYYSI